MAVAMPRIVSKLRFFGNGHNLSARSRCTGHQTAHEASEDAEADVSPCDLPRLRTRRWRRFSFDRYVIAPQVKVCPFSFYRCRGQAPGFLRQFSLKLIEKLVKSGQVGFEDLTLVKAESMSYLYKNRLGMVRDLSPVRNPS
jgi:hypothetical protein